MPKQTAVRAVFLRRRNILKRFPFVPKTELVSNAAAPQNYLLAN
jgi:hypothetical protein